MRTEALGIAAILLVACGDATPDETCAEDRGVRCTCADGAAGTRACGDDTCVCETPACALEHVDAVELGRVPPGVESDHELLLANAGDAPCVVSALRLEGCGGEVSLDAFAGETPIPPGGVLPLPLRFHPENPGDVACALAFDVLDPSSVGTVRLHGVGDGACLQVEPDALSFVLEAAGCGTAEGTVVVTNRCTVPLRLADVAVEGEEFLVLSAPPLPATIAVGRALPVAAGYRPAAPGEHVGELRLAFDGPGPRPIALAGRSFGWRTDSYERMEDNDRACFGLAARPMDVDGDGTIGEAELEVRVDGEVWPALHPSGEELWSYRYTSNWICFGSFVPAPGVPIDVRYRPACP